MLLGPGWLDRVGAHWRAGTTSIREYNRDLVRVQSVQTSLFITNRLRGVHASALR